MAEATIRGETKLYTTTWQDNKPVNILSTFPSAMAECPRNTKEGGSFKKVTIAQPSIVKTYNHAMGGTDKMDQYISYYKTAVRTRNWQQRIFTHFHHVAVVNAYILWKTRHAATINTSLKSFALNLVKQMIFRSPGTASTARDVPVAERESVIFRTTGCHAPVTVSSGGQNRVGKQRSPDLRRLCKLCKHKVAIFCASCGVYLHTPQGEVDPDLPTCWEEWHSAKEVFELLSSSVKPSEQA